MSETDRKPLMRSLGEFVGHIVKGIKTDPSKRSERTVVRETTEEEQQGNVILRRTTIEEIEVRGDGDEPLPAEPASPEPPDSPDTPRA